MQQHQAVDMLSIPGGFENFRQRWVDLGCGTGTFTQALAYHLAPNSRILAIDRNLSSLNEIPDQFNNTKIEKRQADFLEIDFSSAALDGILMANALHYVQHQNAFIEKIKPFLKSNGCFLIVEYDTIKSNPWIPYPLPFYQLNTLFSQAGFSSIKKISEKPSRYNRANLYSAIIRQLPPNS